MEEEDLCKMIDIYIKANIKFTLNDAYWGIKHHWVDIKDVNNAAVYEIMNGKKDNLLYEISYESDPHNVVSLIEQLAAKYPHYLKLDFNIAKRKWRYCKLYSIYNSGNSQKNILENVAILYDDLGFPNDMEKIVYYLPPKDGIYGINHLFENLCQFLNDEKKWIDNNSIDG